MNSRPFFTAFMVQNNTLLAVKNINVSAAKTHYLGIVPDPTLQCGCGLGVSFTLGYTAHDVEIINNRLFTA